MSIPRRWGLAYLGHPLIVEDANQLTNQVVDMGNVKVQSVLMQVSINLETCGAGGASAVSHTMVSSFLVFHTQTTGSDSDVLMQHHCALEITQGKRQKWTESPGNCHELGGR